MIATEHPSLRLALLTVDDINAYYALIERNRRHLTQHGNYRYMLSATWESVRAELATPNDHIVMGVWLDHALIGRVDLIPKTPGIFVIGYWLSEEFLGQGYMTIACRAMIAHARGALGATAIYAGVTKDNYPSEALLTRLGFTLVQDIGSYNRFRLSFEPE